MVTTSQFERISVNNWLRVETTPLTKDKKGCNKRERYLKQTGTDNQHQARTDKDERHREARTDSGGFNNRRITPETGYACASGEDRSSSWGQEITGALKIFGGSSGGMFVIGNH